MNLNLAPYDARGIYPVPRGGPFPARMAWAHPDLFDALARCQRDGLRLVLSDGWRSPEASLARRQEFEARGGRQNAKRPGESPHFFGLSIDFDVPRALRENAFDTKAELDRELSARGLWCHRRDGRRGPEDWHLNALGAGEEAARWLAHASDRSTSRAVEAKIQALYGAQMRLSLPEIGAALSALGYAKKGGSATAERLAEAVRLFQAAWGLEVDGVAGAKTQRLLSCVTAKGPHTRRGTA